MEYSKAFGLVEYITDVLSEVIRQVLCIGVKTVGKETEQML